MDDSDDRFHICFVCAGNICRSPYAEGYLRKQVEDLGWGERVKVSSAGVLGIENSRPATLTIALAAEENIDLNEHRSQGTGRKYLLSCDLVLTMSPDQAALLRKVYPESAARVFLLTAFPSSRIDTEEAPDPIGGDENTYRKVHAQIRRSMKPILSELEQILASEDPGQ